MLFTVFQNGKKSLLIEAVSMRQAKRFYFYRIYGSAAMNKLDDEPQRKIRVFNTIKVRRFS